MSTPPQRVLSTAIKAALSLLVVAVLLRKIGLRDLAARLAHLGALDFVALVTILLINVAVGTARWWRLMTRLGDRPPFRAVLGDNLVGFTFNMFLPTSIGGDVVRALRARLRMTPGHEHRAWSTSIYERIAGLVVLAAMGGLAAAVGLGAKSALPSQLRIVALVLVPVFVGAFFVAAYPFRLLVHVLEKRLPGPALADMRGIIADLEGPLARSGPRAEALAWSVGTQTLGMLYGLAGAWMLDAPGHEVALIIGLPLVHVLSLLPITLGGHGLREGLFVGILGALGLPLDVAAALAALFLAGNVVLAVIGGGVLLVTRPARPPR